MNVELTWNGRNALATYTLKGKNPKAILKELNARSEWGRFDGLINGSFSYDPKTKIYQVNLTPESKITIPEWPASKDQSPKIQQNWQEVIRDLKRHEDGHTEIFENGVDQLKQKLEEMNKTNKSEFKKIMKDAGRTIQKEHNKYDTRTNHGKNDATPLMIE